MIGRSDDLKGKPSDFGQRAEHLVAIALQTGRLKDHARILQFLERNVVDTGKLEPILVHHGLISRWKKFRTRYLDG